MYKIKINIEIIFDDVTFFSIRWVNSMLLKQNRNHPDIFKLELTKPGWELLYLNNLICVFNSVFLALIILFYIMIVNLFMRQFSN